MDGKALIVTERPNYISWEDISSLLRKAHSDNVAKGIRLPYPFLPPEQLRAKTEESGGTMLVALFQGHLAGVGAVRVINKKLWCGSGQYAYCYLAAVDPDYAGKGIYRRIVLEQENIALRSGVSRMLFDTHEHNDRIIEISLKNGYRLVDYKVREDHNSVLLVKWLNGCPYSRIRCLWEFWKRKQYRNNRFKRN